MIVSQQKLLRESDAPTDGSDEQAGSFRWINLLKQTWKEWNEDNGAQFGAALAFYSMLALSPMLLFLVSFIAFFFGETAAKGDVAQAIGQYVGADNAKTIEAVIENSQKKKGAGWLSSAIGVVTMLVGASGVFQQLQLALNVIWDVKPKTDGGILDMVRSRFLSLAMVFGTGFLLLVSLAISAGLQVAQNFVADRIPLSGWLWSGVNFFVTLGIVFVLFGAMYKTLPDAKIQWKHVAIGAFVAAVLFMIAKYLLTLYLGYSAPGSAYGTAGSVVAMVVWIYFSAQILLLGAEFAQVYARRIDSKPIGPTELGESCGRKGCNPGEAT